MKQTIICIVGPSGCGKTTLAKFIEKELGIKTMVSYTTRPKRENEIDGVDHYFVNDDQVPIKEFQLAYTRFGGYQYWTDIRDIIGGSTVTYVIDEKGLMMLMEEWSDRYNVLSVLVKRDIELLIDMVGKDRVERDKHRVTIEESCYDVVLNNNGSLADFLENGVKEIKKLIY